MISGIHRSPHINKYNKTKPKGSAGKLTVSYYMLPSLFNNPHYMTELTYTYLSLKTSMHMDAHVYAHLKVTVLGSFTCLHVSIEITYECVCFLLSVNFDGQKWKGSFYVHWADHKIMCICFPSFPLSRRFFFSSLLCCSFSYFDLVPHIHSICIVYLSI